MQSVSPPSRSSRLSSSSKSHALGAHPATQKRANNDVALTEDEQGYDLLSISRNDPLLSVGEGQQGQQAQQPGDSDYLPMLYAALESELITAVEFGQGDYLHRLLAAGATP